MEIGILPINGTAIHQIQEVSHLIESFASVPHSLHMNETNSSEGHRLEDSIGFEFSKNATAFVLICITEHDIAEADYFLNESPMANMPASNAVASAIRRQVQTKLPVSVAWRNERLVAEIGRWRYELDQAVSDWLSKMVTGWKVGSLQFSMELPTTFLPASIGHPALQQLPHTSLWQRKYEDAAISA